ncbi:MAG: SsrA-binding protein SmpB [Proteobacteria bacterium]|nr:SsrA-binding protein SmpB [Pseudomonadota bacterium]
MGAILAGPGIKIIASNKRAYHEYTITETWEAGIALTGTEVKSLRAGKCNLGEGWVDFDGWVVVLKECHISPYSHGNIMNHFEKRPRQLLLNKKEISKIGRAVESQGMTCVPTNYFSGQRVKVEIALAKGKKLHDKRDTARTKEANRDMARAFKK